MAQRFETIVLVDDDEVDVMLHDRIIRRKAEGAQVVSFHYADEALEYLRGIPDPTSVLLLVDINMPRMDGFTFAEQCNEMMRDRNGDFSLVLLSTSDDEQDIARAKNSQAIDSFLTKPLRLEDLEALLGTL